MRHGEMEDDTAMTATQHPAQEQQGRANREPGLGWMRVAYMPKQRYMKLMGAMMQNRWQARGPGVFTEPMVGGA